MSGVTAQQMDQDRAALGVAFPRTHHLLTLEFGDRKDFDDPRQEWRRLFSELLGTFALVLVAAGGGILHAKGQISLAAAVVAPGLMVMAIILFMGAVSGAHLNPGVSLAFALRGDFPWRRVPGYIIIQLAGATLAALFLRWVFGNVEHLGATLPGPGYQNWQALLMEIVLTTLLVSVILGTASAAQNVGAIAALGVGGYIALAGLWSAPVSGTSMNSARSFGPALVSGDWSSYWVYVVGPIAGALIAVGFAFVLRGRGGDVISRAAGSGVLDGPALEQARHRYDGLGEEGKADGPLVLFLVLDDLTGSFEEQFLALDARLDEIQVELLTNSSRGSQAEVLAIRRRLADAVQSLGWYTGDLDDVIAADVAQLPVLGPGAQAHLDRHRQRVVRLTDAAREYREEAREALGEYSQNISGLQGQVINFLAVISAIFLPLTFITGYFRMNFDVLTVDLNTFWIFILLETCSRPHPWSLRSSCSGAASPTVRIPRILPTRRLAQDHRQQDLKQRCRPSHAGAMTVLGYHRRSGTMAAVKLMSWLFPVLRPGPRATSGLADSVAESTR